MEHEHDEHLHEEHGHEGHAEESVWEHAWEIFTDPAHILAELGWTVIQDVLIIGLLYGVVFKKVILPKLRRDIHKEIDAEHGIEHKED
jgi:hypothetical protein